MNIVDFLAAELSLDKKTLKRTIYKFLLNKRKRKKVFDADEEEDSSDEPMPLYDAVMQLNQKYKPLPRQIYCSRKIAANQLFELLNECK